MSTAATYIALIVAAGAATITVVTALAVTWLEQQYAAGQQKLAASIQHLYTLNADLMHESGEAILRTWQLEAQLTRLENQLNGDGK